jgi:hypothetical protein
MVASGRTRILIRELLSMLWPELHDPSTEEGIGRGLRRLGRATWPGRHILDVAGTGGAGALGPRPEAAISGRSHCAERTALFMPNAASNRGATGDRQLYLKARSTSADAREAPIPIDRRAVHPNPPHWDERLTTRTWSAGRWRAQP